MIEPMEFAARRPFTVVSDLRTKRNDDDNRRAIPIHYSIFKFHQRHIWVDGKLSGSVYGKAGVEWGEVLESPTIIETILVLIDGNTDMWVWLAEFTGCKADEIVVARTCLPDMPWEPANQRYEYLLKMAKIAEKSPGYMKGISDC